MGFGRVSISENGRKIAGKEE